LKKQLISFKNITVSELIQIENNLLQNKENGCCYIKKPIGIIVLNKKTGNVINGYKYLEFLTQLKQKKIRCATININKNKEIALINTLNTINCRITLPLIQELLYDLDTDFFNLSI